MGKIIAFCGLICWECPVYIATKTDNEESKEKLAKEYSTDSFKFEKDDMTCTGCHSTEGVNEKMCVECPMRKCGMEKKLLIAQNVTNIHASILRDMFRPGVKIAEPWMDW